MARFYVLKTDRPRKSARIGSAVEKKRVKKRERTSSRLERVESEGEEIYPQRRKKSSPSEEKEIRDARLGRFIYGNAPSA